MTPRHIAMGVTLVVAAGLVLFDDSAPDPDVAQAVVRSAPAPAPAAAPVRTAAKRASAEPAIFRLLPRAALMGDGDEPIGGSATVFGRQDWNPAPAPVAKQAAVLEAAAPVPVAPALPFTYLGKALDAGTWEVYLARGDKTYVVRSQMVLDGTYRVDAVAPPNLTLTYLPLNQVQQLNIGVFD